MDVQSKVACLQKWIPSQIWITSLGFLYLYFPLSAFSQLSFQESPVFYSIEEGFKKAETFIHNGNHQQAVSLLDDLFDPLRRSGIANANRYFSLVLELNEQSLFDKATLLYLMSLQENFESESDITTLKEEFRYYKLLDDEYESRSAQNLKSGNIHHLGNSMKEFWIRVDPTPGVPANQRLIEHKLRVSEAKKRFPDPDSETGVDGRGETFIRYGEPDRIIDRPLHISRGEVFGFVSEFQMMKDEKNLSRQESLITGSELAFQSDSTTQSGNSSRNSRSQITSNITSFSSDFDAARITDDIIDAIYSNPFLANLRIWIYYRFNHEMKENLILYFSEQKNDVFAQISSLEDWIPQGLFTASSRRTGVSFSPALPLQYLAYQKLMHDDRHFMDIYNKIDQEIFNYPADRSDAALLRLSSQIRSQNQRATHLLELSAPREHSTEIEKLPDIPIEIHQYKTMGMDGTPVFTTFIESRPVVAFVQDLSANLESIEEDEIYVSPEIFNNYIIEQGVELYGSHMQLRGRLRGNPYLNVDQDTDSPTRLIVDIPVTNDVSEQIFYSKLINHYMGSDSSGESIFPKELRGLGRVVKPLPRHINPESEDIFVSDLIIGYERMDNDYLRFPFIVRHNHTIPQNENLVVHFEVFRLDRDESGFAQFEVEYQIESQKRSRGIFRRSRDVNDGILEFTSGSNRFAESLEFEDLQLTPGRYTLTWTVRDLQLDVGYSQELEFEVVEENVYFNN